MMRAHCCGMLLPFLEALTAACAVAICCVADWTGALAALGAIDSCARRD